MGNKEKGYDPRKEDHALWEDSGFDEDMYYMLKERRELDGQIAELAAANTDPQTEPMKSTSERLLDLGELISARRNELKNKGKDSGNKS